MTNRSEVITKFKRELPLPTKDFTDREDKEMWTELVHEHKDVTYTEGRIPSRHINDYYNFKITIPNFLYDYLVNEHPDYDDKYENQVESLRSPKFTKTQRFKSFEELYDFFLKMTNDAMFLKKLEEYEKHKKVIFIRNYYSYSSVRDNYNHADMNKKVNLDYNFFVAYEVPKREAFSGEMIKEYYGLKKLKNSTDTFKGERNVLPYIPQGSVRHMTKINWTQEREDFLKKVEERIAEVSLSVNEFVKKLDNDNFELTMKNIKLLEVKKDE